MKAAWKWASAYPLRLFDFLTVTWWLDPHADGPAEGIPDAVSRRRWVVVVGLLVGAVAVATVWWLGDYTYGFAVVVAIYALMHLGGDRQRAVAGWALTAWALYLLASVVVVALALLVAGVVRLVGLL